MKNLCLHSKNLINCNNKSRFSILRNVKYFTDKNARPMKMRAVLQRNPGSIDSLYIDEVDVPTPGEGECLIKIEAFGINRADILQVIHIYIYK